MTVMPPSDSAPQVTASRSEGPTNEQILEVLGFAVTSTDQLCDRIRSLFGQDVEANYLAKLQAEIREINVDNGWYDGSERPFGDDVALLHSEVSEMYEAYRNVLFEDITANCPCDGEDPNHVCKPEGVGSEAADVLVRLLDTCERHEIDLFFEVTRKLAFNRTRGYRHGGKHV